MNNCMLGKKVRDKITGFEGIVVGQVAYIYGCKQYAVSAKSVDNKIEDAKWFDEGRIEVIGEGIEPKTVQAELPGGPDRGNPVIS